MDDLDLPFQAQLTVQALQLSPFSIYNSIFQTVFREFAQNMHLTGFVNLIKLWVTLTNILKVIWLCTAWN